MHKEEKEKLDLTKPQVKHNKITINLTLKLSAMEVGEEGVSRIKLNKEEQARTYLPKASFSDLQ